MRLVSTSRNIGSDGFFYRLRSLLINYRSFRTLTKALFLMELDMALDLIMLLLKYVLHSLVFCRSKLAVVCTKECVPWTTPRPHSSLTTDYKAASQHLYQLCHNTAREAVSRLCCGADTLAEEDAWHQHVASCLI